jgi:hypothetical protein
MIWTGQTEHAAQIGPIMMTEAQSAVVVIPGLDDDQLVISCAVDDAVLVVDSPGPEAGEIAAQRLWLAGSLERGAALRM